MVLNLTNLLMISTIIIICFIPTNANEMTIKTIDYDYHLRLNEHLVVNKPNTCATKCAHSTNRNCVRDCQAQQNKQKAQQPKSTRSAGQIGAIVVGCMLVAGLIIFAFFKCFIPKWCPCHKYSVL
jgi:hypothetical protein